MKKITEEINRVKTLMHLNEADISGVDELVYNPATKSGGEIGYGYNDGNKVAGLTWKGHEDHLHIAFTDKKTAMRIIDKADEMGLITTENPYSKKDPNGVVDAVHTQHSFHYKNFEGEPLVGKAVDIRGDKYKIIELIRWIEKNYAGSTGAARNFKIIDNPKTEDEKKYNDLLNLKINNTSVSDLPNFFRDLETEDEGENFITKLVKFLSFFSK
jgi:hypothetical protein